MAFQGWFRHQKSLKIFTPAKEQLENGAVRPPKGGSDLKTLWGEKRTGACKSGVNILLSLVIRNAGFFASSESSSELEIA
jgi:hypothetical protein